MLIPKQIFQDFQEKLITKQIASDLLILIIENSNNINIRLESLEILNQIALNEDFYYKYLENLAISDFNVKIRRFCFSIIKTYFWNKALKLIRWALKNEKDYECLVDSISVLKKINNPTSQEILLELLEEIELRKYLFADTKYPTNKFRESLNNLSKNKGIERLSDDQKAEIIINYFTIINLFQKFYTIFFDLEDGLVIHLDLSDVGWNVNLWRQKYTAWITDLSEIPGLMNLKHLKSLDLSNNRISNVKELIKIKNLNTLILCNNKIENIINQVYFKRMVNLKYLDLTGNKIVKQIEKYDYDGIRVIKHKGLPIF